MFDWFPLIYWYNEARRFTASTGIATLACVDPRTTQSKEAHWILMKPEQNQTTPCRQVSFQMAHEGTIILRVTKARPRGYGGEGTRRETPNSWLQMAPTQQRVWSILCREKSQILYVHDALQIGGMFVQPSVELQVLQSQCLQTFCSLQNEETWYFILVHSDPACACMRSIAHWHCLVS